MLEEGLLAFVQEEVGDITPDIVRLSSLCADSSVPSGIEDEIGDTVDVKGKVVPALKLSGKRGRCRLRDKPAACPSTILVKIAAFIEGHPSRKSCEQFFHGMDLRLTLRGCSHSCRRRPVVYREEQDVLLDAAAAHVSDALAYRSVFSILGLIFRRSKSLLPGHSMQGTLVC